MCGKTEPKFKECDDSTSAEPSSSVRNARASAFPESPLTTTSQNQKLQVSVAKESAEWGSNSSNFIFHEDTISLLKNLLVTYGISQKGALCPPFESEKAHTTFTVLCLKLLTAHCSLLVQRGVEVLIGSSLEKKMSDLRALFFQMLDMDLPGQVQQAVSEALATGGSILLPSLREKVRLSLEMLNDVNHLSRGQSLLCKVIFTSLEDHIQVANILALARPTKSKDIYGVSELEWTQQLMSRILSILAEEMNKRLSLMEDSNSKEEDFYVSVLSQKLHDLLTSLQNHIFAHCSFHNMETSNEWQENDRVLWKMLETHLSQVFVTAATIYKRLEDILRKRPETHSKAASKHFYTKYLLPSYPIV
jgi:hypothetical protein